MEITTTSKMYTIDGKEVSVQREIQGGYLAKEVYTGYQDEDETPEETLSTETIFYDQLFREPPTVKFAEKIVEMNTKIQELNDEISGLIRTREGEKSLMSRVSKIPIIQQLVDYINGDFAFVLYLSNLEQKTKNQVYLSPYVGMAHTKRGGYNLYRLRNDDYFSGGDDVSFLVFKTQEEMDIQSKKILIDRIKNANFNYGKSSNLKDLIGKISSSSKAKTDPDVISEFEKKLAVYESQERAERAEKLKKELEDFEKKKLELEKLNS